MPKAHAHRLRTGRHSVPGQTYLVTTVTHQRRPLFAELQPAREVIKTLYAPHRRKYAQTLAHVLMPDHLHWLFTLQSGNLGDVMRRFKSYSARRVNQHSGTTGPVWQQGFHDHALRTDEECKTVARYLVANPLRKGIVAHVGDYPHWDAVWLESDLNEIA